MITRSTNNREQVMPQHSALRLENYPPFKSMNIKVLELDELWQRVRILLPLEPQNLNPGGTMFGGAMSSLADPIAALACAKCFPDYTVWTKSLRVDFLRPGTDDLILQFDFPQDLRQEIETVLAEKGSYTPRFSYGFYRADGTLCCQIGCEVAIRPADPDSHRLGFRNRET